MTPTWIPGAPAAAPVPQATVALPDVQGAIAPGGSSGLLPSPELAFANGLAAYLRASGHKVDPLVAAGAKPADPAHQLIEGAGPRKGLFGTQVKLGQSVYHIYFHPNGRREVVKVAGPGIHNIGVVHPGRLAGALAGQRTGGMLAPS